MQKKINDDNDNWYKDGLRFSCVQCGNCCSGQPGYVWVTPQEIENIQAYLEKNNIPHPNAYLRRISYRFSLIEKGNGDCIFLQRTSDNLALCKIHPVKPSQCKSWPFWSELLKSKEAWDEESKMCPGMNKGKCYSIEEINKIKEH